MLIASRQKRHTLIDGNLKLECNNLELQISSNEKILGVHMDENLVWNNHFQQVSKKDIIIPVVVISNSDLQSNIDCCTIMRI